MRSIPLFFLSALLLLTASCGKEPSGLERMTAPAEDAFILKSTANLQRIAQLTGKESLNQTDRFAVYGTDLGSMFTVEDKTYFVFGDTFGERPEGMTGGGGSFWRSNVMAYSTDLDPSDGIAFDGMITDDTGLAKELIPSKKLDYDEMTVIPTHGLSVDGAMYLYYMSVNHWGDPGEWDANYAGAAKSVDGGRTWTAVEGLTWPGDSGFIQVSPFKIGDGAEADIYFWTIPSGRFGGVKLMRVKEKNIENLGSYEYFAGRDEQGKARWSPDMDRAELVVDDRAGELSVIWNSGLERWLMTYLKEGQGVVLREGLTPWGPWGDAMDLVPAAEYPGLYAPFMNERYLADDGRTIYFALSLWDPYNVFWFKATLEESGSGN
ncbi:DUF4185 domain-containing protein [Paenibacillus macerans]|uniref:DUF4185 domain-containing protein n=1 Tax=Paenibacillus macerans TaxID=44252 RepID=UPI003D3140D3